MKYTKEEINQARSILEKYRNKQVYAIVNSVSRSGMSRRIEYYAVDQDSIQRIGFYIARIAEYPYSVDKGGILATN